MPLTNFPGGAASYGIPIAGQGSVYDMPTGNVWFVCNRTGLTNGDGTSRDRPMVSLADALARVPVSNGTQGDIIYVLPGHAENVTAQNTFSASTVNTGAQTFQPGTRVIGEGVGNARPVFTFTASGSVIALGAASCSLENLILQGPQTGTTTVGIMVNISAAGCLLRNCTMQLASSATALCTTGVQITSGASDSIIVDNFANAVTGTPTSWLSAFGVTGAARVLVARNLVRLPLSATTAGIVDVSANSGTAPADWKISDNEFSNETASSTVAVKGVAGWSGVAEYNTLGIAAASGAASAWSTPGNLYLIQNFGATKGKFGIQIGTTST